jgi:hypothetical protein
VGRGGAGLRGGVEIEKLSILRLHHRVHIITIERGLGKLLLDLSKRLFTYIKLPRT